MENSMLKTLLKYSSLLVGSKAKPTEEPVNITTGKFPEPIQAASVSSLESLVKVDCDELQVAFESANNGDPRLQAAIGCELIDRDSVSAAHWRTRRLAILAAPWNVQMSKVEKGSNEDQDEKTEAMNAALRLAGIDSLIGALIDAAWFGYSGSFIEWNKDGTPKSFSIIHPTRFMFDRAGNPAISLVAGYGDEVPLASFKRGQYIFCRPESAMAPHKAGILRNVAYQWVFRHNAWLWRSRYIERYGQPVLTVTVPQKQWGDKSEMAKLQTAIKSFGSRGYAIIPEGSAMALTSPTGAGNTDYEQFIRALNDEICLAILGQLASSDKAGGLSNGGGQENVRMDIMAADARMIQTAIQYYVVEPMIEYMFGSEFVGKYKFVLDYAPPEDQEIMARVVKLIGDSGYVIDPTWLSEEFGIPVRLKTQQELSSQKETSPNAKLV